MKILIVEDDCIVSQSLELLLTYYTYAVDTVGDGATALQMADAFEYDLVILDSLLPQLDGISVCQQLRSKGFQHPILFLTGQGETHQKAIALNAGADDYLVKPFDAEELIARVQALLRRGNAASQPILTYGNLSLDPNNRRVSYGLHLLSLTPKEYAILELFLRHPEMVFSAGVILDRVWSSEEIPGEETVRGHIKELRQKFTAVGAPKDLIKTVYRVGYRLNALYSSALAAQIDWEPTLPKIAELRSVNEELRETLEQLRSAQAELHQKNQALETAHRTIEQERQQLQVIFNQAFQFIGLLGTDGILLDANQAALEFVGASLDEVVGRAFWETPWWTHDRAQQHRLQAAISEAASGQFVRLEVTHRSIEGTIETFDFSIKPVLGEAGQAISLVAEGHNIEDRKQMERKLQEAHDLLERQVADLSPPKTRS